MADGYRTKTQYSITSFKRQGDGQGYQQKTQDIHKNRIHKALKQTYTHNTHKETEYSRREVVWYTHLHTQTWTRLTIGNKYTHGSSDLTWTFSALIITRLNHA